MWAVETLPRRYSAVLLRELMAFFSISQLISGTTGLARPASECCLTHSLSHSQPVYVDVDRPISSIERSGITVNDQTTRAVHCSAAALSIVTTHTATSAVMGE